MRRYKTKKGSEAFSQVLTNVCVHKSILNVATPLANRTHQQVIPQESTQNTESGRFHAFEKKNSEF